MLGFRALGAGKLAGGAPVILNLLAEQASIDAVLNEAAINQVQKLTGSAATIATVSINGSAGVIQNISGAAAVIDLLADDGSLPAILENFITNDGFFAAAKYREFEARPCYRSFTIDEEGNHLKNFDKKDHEETVTLTFDFRDSTESPTNPSVVVELKSGTTDPDMGDMLTGIIAIDGARVKQRISGGIIGNKYNVRCTAESPEGEVFVIGGILPVVKF